MKDLSDLESDVACHLLDHPDRSIPEVSRALGLSYLSARIILTGMERKGMLVSQWGPGCDGSIPRKRLYRLP